MPACGGSTTSRGPEPSFSPNPKHRELVARADLDPCPSTSASASVESGSLPDVTLPCLGDGPAVRLAALRDEPTLVNIWGSWCGPCQEETPVLAKVYDDLKTKVRFLGVDDEDDPDSALDFAAHVRPPMRYPSVVDDDKKVLVALHTSEVPITLFVDGTGRVVHRNFGPYRDETSLRQDIARYLDVR
jgi:thiol-disulfide isomerase/thioredoxin